MSDAPFVFAKRTSASLMWSTAAALLPALAWGIYCFGLASALPVAASIAGALAGETLASGIRRRFTLWDGSAALTGLLVGMAMPPGISPLIPAASSFFATSVVKGAFGGLGSNWMNPALAGIAFALVDWPAQMGAWTVPGRLTGLAALSGATPLAFARTHAAASSATGGVGILAAGGASFSSLDASVTDALNKGLFSRAGAVLPGGYIDLLLGNKSGAIGEVSAILILAASIVIISRKMIRWQVPAWIVGTFSLLTWTFGGLRLGEGLFAGDVLFALLTGSILIVAFFMATDPVTSPSSSLGIALYGIGTGLLIFLLRNFGSSAEGSAFAVILMNCAVPAIDRLGSRVSARRLEAPAAAEGGRDAAR